MLYHQIGNDVQIPTRTYRYRPVPVYPISWKGIGINQRGFRSPKSGSPYSTRSTYREGLIRCRLFENTPHEAKSPSVAPIGRNLAVLQRLLPDLLPIPGSRHLSPVSIPAPRAARSVRVDRSSVA